MENRLRGIQDEYDAKNELLKQSISGLLTDITTLQNEISDLQEEIDEQSDYIQELEEAIIQHDIEIQDLYDHLFPEETETKIPPEWIASTITNPVDLTGFEEMDPDDSISVNSSTIIWTEMDRSLERRVYTELSESQRQAHITEFSFVLTEFLNRDTFNRRIVSLWMLAETIEIGTIGNRSFTQLYAEEVGTRDSAFKMIMHQRVDGPNTFVDIGPVLDVDAKYTVRIIYYNLTFMYEIRDTENSLVYKMDEVDSIAQDYRYLMFSTMFVNNNDQTIWSSGKITDVKVSD
jgi:hypothetical protein